jgi:predicted nucleic acid-binding protein
MKQNVRIVDEDILERAKKLAAEKDLNMGDVVNRALLEGISSESEPELDIMDFEPVSLGDENSSESFEEELYVEAVFLDSSFLIAFVNDDDQHHQKAREKMKEIEEPVISDQVFTETLDYIFAREAHDKAVEFGKYMKKSQINILTTSEPVTNDAFQLFKTNEISFTDCTTIAAMKILGIQKLATFDTDFNRFAEIEKVPEKEGKQ